MVRLSASLEHLHYDDKVLLGTWFLTKAINFDSYKDAHWWALARLASRRPLYGSQHNVIPSTQVEEWLMSILELDWSKQTMAGFAAVLMASKTGDRSIDVSDELRDKIADKLSKSKIPESWKEILHDASSLKQEQAAKAFGDSLPAGLHLI
ncbi:chaperone protein dnaK [Vibrio ishigakensis]|uniref:Chaperone protein dnaK n=1 Tax=Vibrio ishigakensis TaxID=1481914 RepID=A0A0B8PPX4_9VIBR|nr:chaperone protein dnaK [Vibrio ishigakensis]